LASSVSSGQRRELQWDWAAIQQNRLNNEGAYFAGSGLSPTAALHATWVIGGANLKPYIRSLTFATDTAIHWALHMGSATPTTTAMGVTRLGSVSALNGTHAYAALTATAASGSIVAEAWAPANYYDNIIKVDWLEIWSNSWYVVLQTDMVAANCSATFIWAEYSE
jgi:hypothetical protein